MNDLRLWHLLDAPSTSADMSEQEAARFHEMLDEIKGLVGELSEAPLPDRVPFLARIQKFQVENDPAWRAAQMRILSGMQGWRAWAAVLEGVNDEDPTVVAASLDALVESAANESWLLAHLVFHPKLHVRQALIQYFEDRQRILPGLLLFLLADESCRDRLLSVIESVGIADEAYAELIAIANLRGLISDSLARRLMRLRLTDLAVLWDMPRFSDDECHRIRRHRGALPETYLQPRGASFDGLAWLMGLFWRGDGAAKDPELADEDADNFVELLAEMLHHSGDLNSRWLIAGFQVTAEVKGSFDSRMAGFCAAADPRFLSLESVPAEVRKNSVRTLYQLRDSIPEGNAETVKSIVTSPLSRRDDGHLDLWFLGGLMFYLRKGGYDKLLACFPKQKIVSAFLADPESSAAFFSYSGSIETRQELIQLIRDQRGRLSNMLDAMLVYVVPADGLQFLDGLDSRRSIELLRELLRTSRHSRLSTRKVALVSEVLAANLDPSDFFGWLKEWLENEDPASFEIGMDLLAAMARQMETTELVEAFVRLDANTLVPLTEIIPACSGFPYGAEVALALKLCAHKHPQIKEWAIARVPSEPASPPSVRLAGFAKGEAKAIDPALAVQIANCADSNLPKVVEPCLKDSAQGLCNALAQRKSAGRPDPIVAAAVLLSSDELDEVDREFEVYSAATQEFVQDLDVFFVKSYTHSQDLPLGASAWLCRWDVPAESFAEQVMTNATELVQLLRATQSLRSELLGDQFWFAAAGVLCRWRFRDSQHYQDFVTGELVGCLIDALPSPYGERAATILLALFRSQKFGALLDEYKSRAIDLLMEMEASVRRVIQPWIDSRGCTNEPVLRREDTPIDAQLTETISASTDLTQLLAWCRHHDRPIVENAAIRCVELGGEYLDGMIQLLERGKGVFEAATLAESIGLWPVDLFPRAEKLLNSPELPAKVRFFVGLNLSEAGCEHCLETTLTTLLEPSSPSWLQRVDIQRLTRLAPADWIACRIVTSHHPHAYHFAVNTLVMDESLAPREDSLTEEHAVALRAFLDCGSERLGQLRLAAAQRLLSQGDDYGYPILLVATMQMEMDGPLRCFPREHVLDSVRSAILAGDAVFPEKEVIRLLNLSRYSPEEYHEAAVELISDAIHAKSRQAISLYMRQVVDRSQKLRQVAETFAWGIPEARQLTGKVFSVEMIGGDDLGYTRLNENKVFINPLPLLQRKQHGRQIVEGLILHEIGHHMYHRGEQEQRVWDRADRKGLGSLLNLVADEHLERNLRAMDREYGDRLKRLGAYAFQHSTKEIPLESLLNALRFDAFEVLSGCRMSVARQPQHVKVPTRRVLREMENVKMSFSRFFRALRLGHGTRFDDPKVSQAMELFGKSFRNSSMEDLYEIAKKIREIFGEECDILKCLSDKEDESQVLVDGDGMTNGDVQSEIQRITRPPGKSGRTAGAGRCINVSESLDFNPLTQVERVHATREQHAALASEVKLYANQLRKYLSQLGLVMIPQRRRLRGRALDRAAIPTAIVKSDPRILQQREKRYETDLFIGVAVDCSGSMEFNANIDKAKLFAALLAEAVRGMPAVDLRVFGFTDSMIYDAGNADVPGIAGLAAGGGNNDAGALQYVADQAQQSRRKAKVLVMISDGLPTECSVAALRSLVSLLSRRWKMCCAQVAVQPLEEICFPNYVLLDDAEPGAAVREFGLTIARLVKKSLQN